MSKALAWIRKSRGSDDDIGLEEQRDVVTKLAHELADEVEVFDLGVHTGFSSLTRDDDSDLIDQNEGVLNVVEQLRSGEYDYLVAFDDRRICRDGYLTIITYACKQGDVEIAYVADVAEDELTHDMYRLFERVTKQEEIRKAKSALQRRRENGYDEGRPKWGTTYDADGKYLVPDPETFPDVLTAIEMAESEEPGYSYRDIVERTSIESVGTLKNILDRRDWYRELAMDHGKI